MNVCAVVNVNRLELFFLVEFARYKYPYAAAAARLLLLLLLLMMMMMMIDVRVPVWTAEPAV